MTSRSKKETVSPQEVRFGNLEERLEAQAKSLKILRKELNSLKGSVLKQAQVLKHVEVEKAAAAIKELTEHVTFLAAKAQIDILKLAVVTEVPRIFPNSWKSIQIALNDMPDSWWKLGERLSIYEWACRIDNEVQDNETAH